ncbi:MAG TPA: exopolysaccharide biosynthesis polyprenyl glycosylphosphotransferase [Roseiarcus sp.]
MSRSWSVAGLWQPALGWPRLRRVETRGRLRRMMETLAPYGFIYLGIVVDAATIVGAASASRVLYGLLTLGIQPDVEPVTLVGALVALLATLSMLQRGEYGLGHFAKSPGQVARAFSVWNFAFVAALALGFATKTSSDFSRGAIGVFYFSGFVSLALGRRMLGGFAAWLRRTRLAPPRRVVAIGLEDCLTTLRGGPGDRLGEAVELVSRIALRDHRAYMADDLALAAAAVRMYRPDEVYLAIPWARGDMIEACVDALIRTPAEIHLGAEGILERFGEAKVTWLGEMVGLQVTRPPLSRLQQWEKRAFDIVVATMASIALAPVFAAIALLIRWETPGPALFRQKRYGFNQEPFRIFKFRTMTTMDDGANVVQATRADPRITRVGGFLRRYSIDELPQLINVLIGEMSIVGPRPHALAHDQRYVERLSRYARRHNVKPGITGWAQVWGHRGEIANDHDMHKRLEHDLYYVDNWSLWLDLKIILLTVVSPRAHSKAY